jgi:hypothetical protein
MAKRVVPWWTVVSLLLAALALVRMAEVFTKRELTARTQTLRAETGIRQKMLEDSIGRREALRVDNAIGLAQGAVSPDQTYLILQKLQARGRLMMGPKVVYDFHFRVRGGDPIKVKGQVPELPEGILTVQARKDHTDWFWPDWYYEKNGQKVPQDSNARRVPDAFGRYALLLGGGIALHGVANKVIPTDAIDHVYAELNEKDLTAVYNGLKVGSLVMIQH